METRRWQRKFRKVILHCLTGAAPQQCTPPAVYYRESTLYVSRKQTGNVSDQRQTEMWTLGNSISPANKPVNTVTSRASGSQIWPSFEINPKYCSLKRDIWHFEKCLRCFIWILDISRRTEQRPSTADNISSIIVSFIFVQRYRRSRLCLA